MADQPGYTRLPNEIIEAMPYLGNAELRVLLAIARKTIGYQKESDRISVSQIEDLTGLTRRNAYVALQSLVKRGFITQEKVGKQSYEYSIEPLPVGIQSENHIPSEPIIVGGTEPLPVGIQLEEKPYPLQTPQKKESLKKKEKTHVAPTSFFVVIAEACRIDLQLCTEQQKGQIAQAVKKLQKAGKTPEEIPKVLDWWYAHDWRGKKGDAPRPGQLCDTWQQAVTHQEYTNGHTNGKPLRQSANGHSERGAISETDLDKGF